MWMFYRRKRSTKNKLSLRLILKKMKRVIISSASMFFVFLSILLLLLWLLPKIGYSIKPPGGMEYTFTYALATFFVFSVLINFLEIVGKNKKYTIYVVPILALIYFAAWSNFFQNFSDRSVILICSFLIATYLVKWQFKV